MDKSDWEKLLSIDMKLHYNELKKYIKGIQEYPGCVQMALVSMIYQFGGPGFKKHILNKVGYIQDALNDSSNYLKFAEGLKDTPLAKYKSRFNENTNLIKNWKNWNDLSNWLYMLDRA